MLWIDAFVVCWNVPSNIHVPSNSHVQFPLGNLIILPTINLYLSLFSLSIVLSFRTLSIYINIPVCTKNLAVSLTLTVPISLSKYFQYRFAQFLIRILICLCAIRVATSHISLSNWIALSTLSISRHPTHSHTHTIQQNNFLPPHTKLKLN
jgi:lysylphosphatidylglycerol synthetase-like protein (DUF2156 family)